jgi:hypothetical protein
MAVDTLYGSARWRSSDRVSSARNLLRARRLTAVADVAVVQPFEAVTRLSTVSSGRRSRLTRLFTLAANNELRILKPSELPGLQLAFTLADAPLGLITSAIVGGLKSPRRRPSLLDCVRPAFGPESTNLEATFNVAAPEEQMQERLLHMQEWLSSAQRHEHEMAEPSTCSSCATQWGVRAAATKAKVVWAKWRRAPPKAAMMGAAARSDVEDVSHV